jgi:hypothetical protein
VLAVWQPAGAAEAKASRQGAAENNGWLPCGACEVAGTLPWRRRQTSDVMSKHKRMLGQALIYAGCSVCAQGTFAAAHASVRLHDLGNC